MGNSYIRQESGNIATGNTIEASHLNNEFDALEDAFDASAGHTHDGSTGESQKISLTGSVTGTLPVANGGTNATTASAARTSLGVVIGTDVQAYDAGLLSIAGLTTAADKITYTTASDTYAVTDFTATARSLLDDTSVGAMRTTLGVDAAGTDNSTNVTLAGSYNYLTIASQEVTLGAIDMATDITGVTPVANGGTGSSTAGGARTNLGLVIGTNVQAEDAGLTSIAGLTTAADKMIYTNGSDSYVVTDLTSAGRALLDDADASAQRTTLGLEIGADVQAYDANILSGTVAVADGGTGSTTAAAARANLDVDQSGQFPVTAITSTHTSCFIPFMTNASTSAQAMYLDSTLLYNASTGTVTSTEYTVTSDLRLKKDIDSILNYEAWETINGLQPVQHGWIDGREGTFDGFIAQDVRKVAPQLVEEAEDEVGTLSVNYSKLVVRLVATIQDLDKRVKELEGK